LQGLQFTVKISKSGSYGSEVTMFTSNF